jgi:hypothetical protein
MTSENWLDARAKAQADAYQKTKKDTEDALKSLLEAWDAKGGAPHDFDYVVCGIGARARGVIVRGPTRIEYRTISEAIAPEIAMERGKEGVQIKPKSGDGSFNSIVESGCILWISGCGLDILKEHSFAAIAGPINDLVDRYPGAAELIKGKVSELADGNHAAIVGK